MNQFYKNSAREPRILRTDLALLSQWIKPGSSVLDLGCGDGRLLAHLQRSRQVKGYGVEIDDQHIQSCLEQGINVLQVDLNQGLTDFFEEKRFDYVIMSQALQAIHRPDLLLEDMLYVAHEGIVSFPNFGHWISRIQLFFAGHMPHTRALPHHWYDSPNIHLCTMRDFENLCAGLGIEILQNSALDPHHRSTLGMRHLPNLLGEVAVYHFKKQD